MKKTVALLAVLFLLTSPGLVLAGGGAEQGAGSTTSDAPVARPNIFQKVANTITASGHPATPQEPDKVEGFRQASDQIASWDVYAAQAKKLSLRGNKQELLRRHGVPPGVPIE